MRIILSSWFQSFVYSGMYHWYILRNSPAADHRSGDIVRIVARIDSRVSIRQDK